MLLEFTEKPFTLDYGIHNKKNGFWNSYNSHLQVGNYENAIGGEKENLYATLTHELGHYLDLYSSTGVFYSNSDITKIYEEEFNVFQNSVTTAQQKYISYFTNGLGEERGHQEKVAETHAIMYSTNDPMMETRRLYLAQYFPRTMAEIMKQLLEEEGVKTN